MTIDKLKDQGHKLVPFVMTFAEMQAIDQVFLGFAKTASIPDMTAHAKKRYEYPMPFYSLFITVCGLPNWIKSFAKWFLTKFTSE